MDEKQEQFEELNEEEMAAVAGGGRGYQFLGGGTDGTGAAK